MVATAALCEVLNRGISSGNLVDTKIILYSHRDSDSGRVCRPKALYTNSNILKTVPHFNDLLFGNFAESQSRDFDEAIDEDEFAEGYGYSSDSDLEDDEDKNVFSLRQTVKSEVCLLDPFAVPGEESIACEVRDERVEKGKVVKIPDIALVTFQAFLMYLYTNEIEFAPFGSDENRRSRSVEIAHPCNDKVPRPSPKSIYRFADKYDVPVLKTLALNHIRSELAKCDIVEESFSRFAYQYDEVRNLYAGQLASAWMEDSTAEKIRAEFEKKVDSFVEGDLDHAAELLSAFWEVANKDEDVNATRNPEPAVPQVANPAHWASVNAALIKSIRTGIFFDRKYWAINSKTGDVLKPIHFSSTIMGDKGRKLNKLVKYIKRRNPSMSDLGLGDDNVESDCDRPVITNYPSFPGTSPSSAFSDAAVSSPSSPPPPQGPSQPSPTVSTRNANRRNAPMNPPVLSPLSSPSSRRPSRPAPTASVSHESWHELVSEPVEQTLAPGFNWEPVPAPNTLPPLLRTPVQPTPLLVPHVTSSSAPTEEERGGSAGGDSSGVTDESWSAEENEAQNRAVLVTGSFSAWRSLFFYRCTDDVSFAPLKSQGLNTRWNYVREKTIPTAPPPCSPKSIYLLASLLDIQPLRERALADIKSKVARDNVVGEVFSWITANQKELLEMECDILVANSKGRRTLSLVKQNIQLISDGSSPHCGDALKLGFEKALKRKKEKGSVKLRCTHGSCTWYSNHVSYSTIGTSAYYCQMCLNRGWGSRYFQCVGCGHNRTSNYTSCQSCKKRFA